MAHMTSEDLVKMEPAALNSGVRGRHHQLHWGQDSMDLVKCFEVIQRIHLGFEVEIACFDENLSVRIVQD